MASYSVANLPNITCIRCNSGEGAAINGHKNDSHWPTNNSKPAPRVTGIDKGIQILKYTPNQDKPSTLDASVTVSYTHLTLPTICSV